MGSGDEPEFLCSRVFPCKAEWVHKPRKRPAPSAPRRMRARRREGSFMGTSAGAPAEHGWRRSARPTA